MSYLFTEFHNSALIVCYFLMIVYVGHTGEHLGTIVFHKEVMKVMEADFLTIHVSEIFLSALQNSTV